MTDMPDVTDSQDRPSLDDIADVVASTNRGLRALERMVSTMFDYISVMFALLTVLLFVLIRKVNA